MNKKHNISDLVKNTSFLKWLNKEEGADTAHWEKWEQNSEDAPQLKEDAQLILKGIRFKKGQGLKAHPTANWKGVAAKIEEQDARKGRYYIRPWWAMAASIALILCAAAGFYSYFHQTQIISYQTDFAQKEMILLPDGSEIVLGPNSHLSYAADLAESTQRTVSLDGIAYFKVANQERGKAFVVGLKDIEVAVIGTEFNVNSHRQQSIISLVEGQVLLSAAATKQNLQAGQTAYYNATKEQFEINNNQTEYWSSWIIEQWALGDGTPMKEVIQRIEETYGLSCQLADPTILDKLASGDISIESQEVLFESLSYLLNVDFDLDGETLRISLKEDSFE